ncbi:MAG: hypothetical protein R6W91_07285 [Thermoplasmata archaeon]
MLDWLISKIGVLIAIGVLTTFVLGLFAWQHSVIVDGEGQKLADGISGVLDEASSLEAATVLNISFGRDSSQLPTSIGGKPYSINITADSVIITSGNRIWMSGQVSRVIPQNLSARVYNLTEYESLELGGCTGEHPSNGNFYIERALVDISGEKIYITLAYWE